MTTPASAPLHILDRLVSVIEARRGGSPDESYTASLLVRGPAKAAQKFGEEAIETVIAGAAGDRTQLIAESADALYHLLVLWAAAGIDAKDVWAALARREGRSGLAEKASRPT